MENHCRGHYSRQSSAFPCAKRAGPYNSRVPGAVQILEQEFAAWLGVPDAIAAGFGRAALRLGLEALECKGRTVLLPEFICTQVVDAARDAGAEIFFYPIERDLTIRVDDFANAFTPGIHAALVPHYYGRVAPNTAEFSAVCRERGVLLIEDCALSWGASLQGRLAGRFGDIAVFSCTKSDWCYGGGMLALHCAELAARARAVRSQTFEADPGLLLSYGLLRQTDFLANRPRWSSTAERIGRRLERIAGFEGGNFYDAGTTECTISSLGARRARRILRELPLAIRRRRDVKRQLVQRLRDCPQVLFAPDEDPGETGAFLLVHSPSGRARDWVEEAGRKGITLRLSWPAYQELPEGKRDALEWLAEHLLILEVHPGLTEVELERIAACVRRLAANK